MLCCFQHILPLLLDTCFIADFSLSSLVRSLPLAIISYPHERSFLHHLSLTFTLCFLLLDVCCHLYVVYIGLAMINVCFHYLELVDVSLPFLSRTSFLQTSFLHPPPPSFMVTNRIFRYFIFHHPT